MIFLDWSLDTQTGARRALQLLMREYYDESNPTLNNTRFRNIVHSFSVLLNWYKFEFESSELEDIKDYDMEIELGKNPIYNSGEGIIYKDGQIFTTDYTDDESKIIIRDIEGIIIDAIYSREESQKIENRNNNTPSQVLVLSN